MRGTDPAVAGNGSRPGRVWFATSGRSAGVPAAAAEPDPDGRDGADPELAPGAVVDLDEVRRDAGVDDVLDALDRELVGLAPVKERLRELAALLVVDRVRERFGVAGDPPTLHMCFTGNPGTGKTTVALRLGDLLQGLGYLRRGHLVTATRDDLVGQYVGHTAPKTKEILKRSYGGVLFIDEAYYLYRPDNERDYGQEAIEILLQEMESARASLVVIFAGYEDRMETFFSSNPGLSSRVAHHIQFEDYATDELAEIAELMLTRDDYCFTEAGRAAFLEYLERRRTMPRFANARSVRNALERARLRQANRLVALPGQVGRDDLMLITEEDIRRSRIFAATPEGA